MAVHGPDIYLVDSLLPHDLLSFVTVLLRKLLIIQIMQKAGHASDFLVLALQSGKVGHDCLHSQGVFLQSSGLGVFCQQFLGICSQ